MKREIHVTEILKGNKCKNEEVTNKADFKRKRICQKQYVKSKKKI